MAAGVGSGCERPGSGCERPGSGGGTGAMAAARRAAAAAALEVATAVPRDVVLFRHDRDRFFRLAGFFCAGQGLFWTYLAHFAFTALRPASGPGPDDPLRPRDNKWRFGFTASCLTLGTGEGRLRVQVAGPGTGPGASPTPSPRSPVPLSAGSLIVAAGCLFPLRAVRRITLLRGGTEVTISTHGPLGLGRGPTVTVPLRHVSCRAHRSEVPATVPLKVKGRPFFFLLDKRGQLCHPRLFDLTVGAYRKL